MSEASKSMVDRIKNRSARATVPERNMSLAEISPTEVSSSKSETTVARTSPASTNPDLAGLPEVASRRQIRLEIVVDSEIETLCKQKKITMETYFEALHLACKDDPILLERVIKGAKERLLARKKAGKIRRLQTQMKQEYSE